jgi:hypothetical protein
MAAEIQTKNISRNKELILYARKDKFYNDRLGNKGT